MKKLKTILSYKVLLLFLLICVFRFVYSFKYDVLDTKNNYIVGKITYIRKSKDNTIFDVKGKNKYRVTYSKAFNYKLGDIVKIKGDFKIPSNNTVFNTFNYRKYLLSKKIFKIIYNPKIKLINIEYKVYQH